MATVLVGGAVANKCLNGGEAWVRLSWLLGLQRLGCQVFFVEQIDSATCVDEEGRPAPFETSLNRRYFDDVMREFGLTGSAALLHDQGEQTSGLTLQEVLDVAGEADLLVNVSGHIDLEPVMARVRSRAFIDLDPGFTQIWHEQGLAGTRLAGHDHYFTVGENIGKPGCPIPTGGLDWRPLPPPVVLEEWPATPYRPNPVRFTTVGAWRGSFGPVEHDGRTYGVKVHEFRKVIELPQRADTGAEFEIALDIHPGDARDRDALLASGWALVDPRVEASGPDEFRRYVSRSGAEFSVAQGIYVDTGSGWFSDRTVKYLAAGKPALVQDTGFSENYPVGEGLVPFSTVEEAARGAERIASDYETHAEAARALAEQHFDSDKVLAGFLEQVGVTP
jgi:hypothetical protein